MGNGTGYREKVWKEIGIDDVFLKPDFEYQVLLSDFIQRIFETPLLQLYLVQGLSNFQLDRATFPKCPSQESKRGTWFTSNSAAVRNAICQSVLKVIQWRVTDPNAVTTEAR